MSHVSVSRTPVVPWCHAHRRLFEGAEVTVPLGVSSVLIGYPAFVARKFPALQRAVVLVARLSGGLSSGEVAIAAKRSSSVCGRVVGRCDVGFGAWCWS